MYQECCTVLSNVLATGGGSVAVLADGPANGPGIGLPGGVFTVELEANA